MIEALGDPRFYVVFWSVWLAIFTTLLWTGIRLVDSHARAAHLNLDAIYQELRQLNARER